MYPSKLEIDRSVSKLRLNSKEFSNLSNDDLIFMLQSVIRNIKTTSYYWISVASENKGYDKKHLEGEDWVSGPFSTILAIEYYIKFLQNESNLDIRNFDEKTNTLKVFPNNNVEKLTFPFLTGEVVFNKTLDFEKIDTYRGFSNRYDKFTPKITLVLGAGNVSSIPLLDALFHIIAYRSTIFLKLNPVNEYLKPVFEQILMPFIDRGYLIVSNADIEASEYLCDHDNFNHIHLTGSNFTYEQIVYKKVLSNKERSTKTLKKVNKTPITTELGNVTPFIIHPGSWTKSEIKYQARKIVTAKLNNSGFNCIAAQIIVMPKDWSHAETLKKYINYYLKKVGDTFSYYPGSNKLLQTLQENDSYSQVNDVSCKTPFLVSDIENQLEFEKNEVWSSVLYFKEIDHDSVNDYVNKAVDYVNSELWGNLGVSILFKHHNKKRNNKYLSKYTNDLKYGTVAINEWAAIGYVIPTMPWGGYPGNPDYDIQSGQGFVHNALFLESPLKGVVKTRFRLSRFIDPPWFVTNKKSHRIFKNLTYYQATKSKVNFIKLIFSTLI